MGAGIGWGPRVGLAVMAAWATLAGARQPGAGHAADPPAAPDVRAMIASAVGYLRGAQDPASGGWGVPPGPGTPRFPAITGLVLRGMIENGSVSADDAAVRRGVAFVLSFRQKDGGIYDRVLPSYNTAICLSLLTRLRDPEARAAIEPAARFLRSLQFGEDAVTHGGTGESARPVERAHAFYGGVGYGRSGRPDLSNTAFFLEALRDAGVEGNDPAVRRALVFLQRLQMSERVNDQPYAAGSTQGGFIYATSASGEAAGGGQSFAGEVAESLSGPPGLAARVRLGTRDGKPRTLDRAEVERRIGDAAGASSMAALRGLGDRFMVLLGPTPDGAQSGVFEVRAALADKGDLEELLRAALGGDVEVLEVEAVSAWRGVSRLRAYGSMTYAGFKSYLYADLSRTDPRVVSALGWISRHYTLDENPGLGTEGLYYYYLTLARAMAAWGMDRVEVHGPGGPERRDWARDLVAKLSRLQRPDGSFTPVDDRWMENDPVLITAYALIALQQAAR
ncbi:MAG: hypothetical protein FJ255_00345 [Phycisphaerae bacterium]|nr:hypothetical protein [Phycisphaerae bacterium]